MDDPASHLFWGLNEAGAIIVTGIVGVVLALITIISQRSIAARQATIEYIQRAEADNDLLLAKNMFNEIARSEQGTGVWVNQPLTPEFRAITSVLNQYEMVAIAIQRGTFDDVTYRRWYRTSVLRAWKAACPFVLARRAKVDNDALWHEFEEMATWYRGGRVMPHRRFIWRRFF